MPLHRFFIPSNLYSDEDKQTLSKAITDLYVKIGLPEFYVVVLFIEVPRHGYFVGGKATDNFVRVVVHHLAKQFAADNDKTRFMDTYEQTIAPFTKARGVDWEVEVIDSDPQLWRENGIVPPHVAHNAEIELLWAKENRPIPYY
ncbi:putative oxalocrotonate tautomerase [Armillaria mellea]|nr:putative oxalocrotonate tautomerase [Armillaria mellea]